MSRAMALVIGTGLLLLTLAPWVGGMEHLREWYGWELGCAGFYLLLFAPFIAEALVNWRKP